MDGQIRLSASRLRRRKKIFKISCLLLLILSIIIVLVYLAVSFVYNGYYFAITLDKDLYLRNKVVIYDDPNYKVYRSKIYVESMDFFDDISEKWLPNNLDETNGSHNGESYLAYTFFIENLGDEVVHYYDELIIDDVIKNLDEAIRFRIYIDGTPTVYAKKSPVTGEPEVGTTAFVDEETVYREKVENFSPGEIHRYTIVMWIEGNDLECTNNILGGEIKVHYDFKSYHIEGRDDDGL